ncbi:HAD family hydrolase [Xanthomonas theicola]|uniref:Phosphotransferase n=1 Tax=Xanthomonas theicola TaxID=56464 RepID=A0A2S6ZB75_9XANT|nr:HAD family hydrolase [Xanthomonas theicola]PPT82518.1 phosphotransferase [Xanthomonas theicola]QNH25287.1 HAD family hydrolase [Xanthomonas theicola]
MPHPGSLALFDFDHTVTTGDSYSRFLRRVATPQQLARAKWSVGAWLAGYRLGLVPARAIRRRVTHVAFAGRAAAEIAAQADAYARQVLPTLLRPEMMQRIAWHHAQGHRIALVSGSLDLYLQPWCDEHGLELICNRLEQRAGRLTGRYADGDCGPHKARLVRARYDVAAYPRVYAYGDSREDRPMLALAHERWYRGRRVA